MPTMNIPGVGAVEKKYVYVGAAGIAGFVGYMYYRNRNSAVDDTAVSDTVTDPALDSTAFDPGLAGDYGYSYDMSGSTPIYQSPVNQTIPVTSQQQITTDAAWDSEAVNRAGDIGAEASAVSSALGRFLASLCVSEAQADLVRQVEGLLGRPPQSPSLEIHICPGSPTTTPPAGTATTPTGFRVSATDKAGVTLTWSPVAGAQRYLIHVGGGPQKYDHWVADTAPPYRVGALTKNSTYNFSIKSQVGGVDSPASATVSGKTKAK